MNMNKNNFDMDVVVEFIMNTCNGVFDEDDVNELLNERFNMDLTDEILGDIDCELDKYYQYQY